jgi:hypothetical protein
LDPGLLINPPGFALPKQANPRRQKPAGYESTKANKEAFPDEQGH